MLNIRAICPFPYEDDNHTQKRHYCFETNKTVTSENVNDNNTDIKTFTTLSSLQKSQTAKTVPETMKHNEVVNNDTDVQRR